MRWFKKRGLYKTKDGSYVIFRRKKMEGAFAGCFIFTNLVTGISFPVPSAKRKTWLLSLTYCKANVKCRVTKYDGVISHEHIHSRNL